MAAAPWLPVPRKARFRDRPANVAQRPRQVGQQVVDWIDYEPIHRVLVRLQRYLQPFRHEEAKDVACEASGHARVGIGVVGWGVCGVGGMLTSLQRSCGVGRKSICDESARGRRQDMKLALGLDVVTYPSGLERQENVTNLPTSVDHTESDGPWRKKARAGALTHPAKPPTKQRSLSLRALPTSMASAWMPSTIVVPRFVGQILSHRAHASGMGRPEQTHNIVVRTTTARR